jgi:tetratricopeptide (TPR) repeat protein
MAKKRLNKKVAMIGSAVFMLVAVLVIGGFLYLSRDPQKFIKDGDQTLEAARQAMDQQQREDLYKAAETNYRRAYGHAKTDELKIVVLYKLVDVFMDKGQWRDALGSWTQIVRLAPKDIKARYCRLKYFYIVADISQGSIWQEVASQASDFIEIVEKPGADPELAATNTSKWDIDVLKQKGEQSHRLAPYLHLIRGRANMAAAELGIVTNREETLKLAFDDLEKVKQLEPNNVDVYLYLAQGTTFRSELQVSKGDIEAKQAGYDEAISLLKQGVEANKESVQAKINLLTMKHSLAQATSDSNQQQQVLALEPEYLELIDKYGSNPDVFEAITVFYSDYRLGPAYLDKAIVMAEKTLALDENNPDFAIRAANLYNRRFHIRQQNQDMIKTIEIAKKAILLPDVQDTTGPRASLAKTYQLQLNGMLANSYMDQIFIMPESMMESEGQKLLSETQQAIRLIEQLYGSGDDPQVIKWQGMYELVAARLGKGDASAAIKKLYKTYTQMKASDRLDPYLSYRLAKSFSNSNESGVVGEFLIGALENGLEGTQPEVRLDYAEFMIKMGMWKQAQRNIDLFDERCGANEKSRILRITSHIGAKEYADAEQDMEQMSKQDPNWLMLKVSILEGKSREIRTLLQRKEQKQRTAMVLMDILTQRQLQEPADQRSAEQLTAEMKGYLSAFLENIDAVLEKDPNSLGSVTAISMCEDAIAAGQIDSAKIIADKFLKYQPDNISMLVYKQLLAEPEPTKVSADKTKQIRESVISEITDPARRASTLGTFYQTNNEPNKAEAQFKKLVPLFSGAETVQADDVTRHRAAAALFEITLNKKDWDIADKIIQMARQENIDESSGDFFAARLALAKEQYETALASIDSALAQRPVFGYGYLLRSRINLALGKDGAALSDIQTAANMNPMDKSIARERASQLYQRNKKLGNNVSSAQLTEARGTLDWAMALNPGDAQLLSFYAEYISDSEPERALALRQSLQENSPSLPNALLLSRLATKLAMESTDTQKRQALLSMAFAALEQAKSYDPQNPAVLESYTEFYRQTGEGAKAEQMLTGSKEPRLLWRYYVKAGRYEDAKKTLDKAYEANPKDTDTIKGLLFLAEKTGDKESVVKHAEQLLAVEQTVDNHLLLIQTYLNASLVKEAEQQLASFRERYPADSRGLLLGAWLSMKQGHTKEALELTNKRLERDQNDATAWQLRGQVNYTLSEYDQSIMDLKHSKVLADTATTRLLLSKTYLKIGRTEDAITELKSIFEDPQAPEEARNLLERIYMQNKRKEALDDFYSKVTAALPESIQWQSRAAGFAAMTENWSKAGQLYELALQKCKQQNIENPDALGGYLKALLTMGQTDKLFVEGGKYIDGNLAPVAYFRMAEGKMKLGDRDTAIQYCSLAIKKSNENITMITQVIENMFHIMGLNNTEQVCNQYIEKNPDTVSANWALYNLCKLKGDYNKGVEYIDVCIKKLGPDSESWPDCILQKAESLVMAYTKTSDNNYLKSAMEAYESLLVKMPNSTYVLNNMAYLLAENNKDLDKAMEYAKRACDARPDNPMYLDTYAYACYKSGKYKEAAEFAQASIQQYESQQIVTPVEVYEHLGQSQEKLGDKTQARAAYQQALEAGGDNMQQPVKDRITAELERLGK